MEAPKPILAITPGKESENITFIEDLNIKYNNKDYKMQFGIREYLDQKEMIIRIIPKDNEEYNFQFLFSK